MTQEEKDLLLKDLCGRLPYGVKGIRIYRPEEIITLGEIIPRCQINSNIGNGLFCEIGFDEIHDCCTIADFKPYLRSMSNMTDEEKEELYAHYCKEMADNLTESNMSWEIRICVSDAFGVDWLNKNMFDYRGLIPMGLALEALEGMYK